MAIDDGNTEMLPNIANGSFSSADISRGLARMEDHSGSRTKPKHASQIMTKLKQ